MPPTSEIKEKADPELLRQLEADDDSDEPVVAVVRLKPEDPSQIVPPPERTAEIAESVLERVKQQVGGEERHNVFQNLGYFVVAANRPFIRELISQPEVAKVIANQQPGSAVAEPVERRPVAPATRETERRPRPKKATKARAATRKPAGK
jgi:hypothetical protein